MEKIKPNKRRKTSGEMTTVDIFIKVQVFALGVYIAIFMLFCIIALMADLAVKYDYVFSLAGFALGSFATGFFSGLKLRQNGLLSGLIYSLPANTLVVLVSLIFSDFNVGINIVVTAVVLLVSAAVGGVVAVNRRRKR